MRRIALALALVTVLAMPAGAAELHGRIVRVADGDTVTILDAAKRQHRIRIVGIDAPERRQAFGDRSRQRLRELAHGADARADCPKTDLYGRLVCTVWIQPPDCPRCGQTLDIGHAQVLAGLAWWFRRYAAEQTPDQRGRYESAEREARVRRMGYGVILLLYHLGSGASGTASSIRVCLRPSSPPRIELYRSA